MHAEDIQGSIAYAKALAKSGLLSSEEAETMVEGLKKVGEEWKAGQVSGNRALLSQSWLNDTSLPVPSPAGRRRHPHRERTTVERTYRQAWWKATHRSFSK